MEFRTSIVPMTNNRLIRSHWSVRRKEKLRWAHQIMAAVGRKKRRLQKLTVSVVVGRKRLQDLDNFHASLKPLLDALKFTGWIYDDSRKWIDLKAEEIRSKQESTQISVSS